MSERDETFIAELKNHENLQRACSRFEKLLEEVTRINPHDHAAVDVFRELNDEAEAATLPILRILKEQYVKFKRAIEANPNEPGTLILEQSHIDIR